MQLFSRSFGRPTLRLTISPELSRRNIHVWTLPTDAPDKVVEMFNRVLAPDETDRAARFRFDHLRESFTITRGALRYLLGSYLNVDPSSIRFTYGSKGKPALPSATDVRFNVTHSGRLAVIALASGTQIGVDAEQIRPLPEMQQIANRFFCAEEASDIMSLSKTQGERAFFCCWTRKEAYIKAVGEGLRTPLNAFRVSVHPNSTPRLIHIENDSVAAQGWMLHDLHLAADYAAALAYRDRERSLALFPVTDLMDLVA